MEVFKIIYTALGGLGLFFYGMKVMSESMQSLAGNTIREIINTLTKNALISVAVGCAITMLVQSSSVTSVMIVGLVNAGLMNLTQAIGVLFGANIGTTITGWIISIKVGKYGLLLIGLGIFPSLFSKNERLKEIGRALFGIGMVFFGLELMSGAFKPLRSMDEFLNAISFFSGQHYGAYLASAVVGCILTVIIQSSSAMLGITMALATSGVIELHTALALVMGENVGTTITAQLAAIGGNINAKRAAKAHAFFNVAGVVALMLAFPYYVKFVEWVIPGAANFLNSSNERPNIAVHIATAHTIFNVTATLLFLPFVGALARFVTRIHPDEEIKEQTKLEVLGDPEDMIPATGLILAQKELEKLKDITDRMFNRTTEYISLEDVQPKLLAKIKDYERITDNIQKEITVFILKLQENKLSDHESLRAQQIVQTADELESVCDYLDKLVTSKTRFCEQELFRGEIKDEFIGYLSRVRKFYDMTTEGVVTGGFLDELLVKEEMYKLKQDSEGLRMKVFETIKKEGLTPNLAMAFSDMVMAAKKVRTHSMIVLQINNA